MYRDDDTIANTCAELVRALADGRIDRDAAMEQIGTLTYGWITTDIALTFRFRDDDSPFDVYVAFIRRLVLYPDTVRKALDAGAPPRAYFWTIARNAALDRLQIEERDAKHSEVLRRTLPVDTQFAATQETDLLSSEQEKMVRLALQELGPEDRWLIVQSDFRRAPARAIAVVLGCDEKEARLRTAKARRRFMKVFKTRWAA